MHITSKTKIALLVSCLFLLPATAQAYQGYNGESRTAGRAVNGTALYPTWLMARPEHYEFLPYTSNHEPHNQHSMQWKGQEWDTSAWNEKWTPESAIYKFYEAGIFKRQYRRKLNSKAMMPVVDVGPTFFKLSELDQSRAVKLLADSEDIFAHGYDVIELRDAGTGTLIGSYTAKGMQLN